MDTGSGERRGGAGVRAGGRWPLLLALAVPAVLFAFTLDRYYGYYYDNKFFNLLALEIWKDPALVLYLGSHYHVPSSLYSYISWAFFHITGPGDLGMEVPAALFHLATVALCYRLGSRFHGPALGGAFAIMTALAPMHLVQVYTLPDLSFAVFLNVASAYLFMTGFERSSPGRLATAGLVYALGCFQAIYSILLLPFFLFYSVLLLLSRPLSDEEAAGAARRGLARKAGLAVLLVSTLPPLAYLYLVARETFLSGGSGPVALVLPPVLGLLYIRRRGLGPGSRQALTAMAFSLAAFSALAIFDLIVQIDYHYLDRALGYYRDASLAGGYGGRPLARYHGAEITVLGKAVYMSVLTSAFEFVEKDFARVSYVNIDALRHLYTFYFEPCFSGTVKVFFFTGVGALVYGTVGRIRSGRPLALYAYPLVWLAVVLLPFADLGPGYFNIRRVYIIPLPYLVAAFGVACAARLVAHGVDVLKNARRPSAGLAASACLVLALAVAADQARFSWENIYARYSSDRASSMYFKLFYGHYYGRSYREVGDFIRADAPPPGPEGGPRAAVVYAIPEDSKIGRSLPLYNTLEWYSRRGVLTQYGFEKEAEKLYGTRTLLRDYLSGLFAGNPGVSTVYFADFNDSPGDGFSYFSDFHPGLEPYAMVNEDGPEAYDCVLYRFDRDDWAEKAPPLRAASAGYVS